VQTGESLDDMTVFDRAVRELQEHQDEVVPASTVHRVIAGENPIRVWREYRRLSQTALAARSGLSQSYVAMLEGGSRKATTENLNRLAQTLDVDFEHLLVERRGE
jgi:predicted transcriptional regulator